MVRALIKNDVSLGAYYIFGAIFFVLNLYGAVDIYANIQLRTPEKFPFPEGMMIDTMIIIISSLLYWIAPVFIAWKKMTIKEYVKYFVCTDLPVTILSLAVILAFLLSGVLMAMFGIINFLDAGKEGNNMIAIISFAFQGIVALGIACAKPYLMHQVVVLRKKHHHKA